MKLKKKLNKILLVDDEPGDNVYHKIILRKMDIVNDIDVVLDGVQALNYLKREGQTPPELILLDINMPKMNGWEFLEQYKQLSRTQKARMVIIILSTSTNPEDIRKAKEIEEVKGYEAKPLTEERMTEILKSIFKIISEVVNVTAGYKQAPVDWDLSFQRKIK